METLINRVRQIVLSVRIVQDVDFSSVVDRVRRDGDLEVSHGEIWLAYCAAKILIQDQDDFRVASRSQGWIV